MEGLDSVKLLVVGDKAVGKTSLVQRFVTGDFPDTTKSSVCVNYFYRRMDTRDEKELMVNVYDAPSAPESRELTSFYYWSVQGIMVLYDVNDEKSILGLSTWLKEIEEKILRDTVVMLVGNKKDLKENGDVSTMAAKKAAQNGVNVVDVSSLTGENVDAAFRLLIDKIIERRIELQENRMTSEKDNEHPQVHPAKGRTIQSMLKKMLKFFFQRSYSMNK